MHLPIDEINFDDRYFKISREHIDESLRLSIMKFGVLDPPVVIQTPSKFKIVFGFNRLSIMQELGFDMTPAVILPGIDAEWYMNSVLLKCHRNECGPVGRLKILNILKDMFSIDAERIAHAAASGLHIPEYFIQDDPLRQAALGLPDTLKSYIDHNNIQHKFIRDLLRLPPPAIAAVCRWLDFATIRVNIFKGLIDMIADIYVRDGTAAALETVTPDESGDRARWDEYLFNRVFRLRYPDYSSRKMKADDIVSRYSSRGIRIDYPAFFEGDTLNCTVSIRKGEEPQMLQKKINEMDMEGLRELLELL
jgi:hypothetical protein